PQKEPDQLVPAKRLPRDSSIHERHRNISRFAFAQEVWPQLGLHDQHGCGIDRLQGTANGPAPVERKVKDAVGLCAKDVARELLSRECDLGDYERVMREFLFDSLLEWPRVLSFADRNAVQPDDRFTIN